MLFGGLKRFIHTLTDGYTWNNNNEFCKAILINNIRINKFKDRNNNTLTDKFLCEALERYLELPICDLYKKVCGFVHFSSSSFYNIVKTHEKYEIAMFTNIAL